MYMRLVLGPEPRQPDSEVCVPNLCAMLCLLTKSRHRYLSISGMRKHAESKDQNHFFLIQIFVNFDDIHSSFSPVCSPEVPGCSTAAGDSRPAQDRGCVTSSGSSSAGCKLLSLFHLGLPVPLCPLHPRHCLSIRECRKKMDPEVSQ